MSLISYRMAAWVTWREFPLPLGARQSTSETARNGENAKPRLRGKPEMCRRPSVGWFCDDRVPNTAGAVAAS
jgi:hypothetical protein